MSYDFDSVSSKSDFENKATAWFGMEVKSWLPVAVLLVSLVSFFIYQEARISTVEARSGALDVRVDNLSVALQNLSDMVARVDERTKLMQGDINFIKQQVK